MEAEQGYLVSNSAANFSSLGGIGSRGKVGDGSVLVDEYRDLLEDRAEHSFSSSPEPIPLFDHVSAKDLAVILEYLNKSNEIRSKSVASLTAI
ncbi:hypothetical protein LINPERHAP1_LOCUS15548 [Linum perenne]